MRWTLLSVVFPSGLRSLYELREMRWIEARHTLDKEKEKALLLSEVLSVGVVRNLIDSALWAARAIDSYFGFYLFYFGLALYDLAWLESCHTTFAFLASSCTFTQVPASLWHLIPSRKVSLRGEGDMRAWNQIKLMIVA